MSFKQRALNRATSKQQQKQGIQKKIKQLTFYIFYNQQKVLDVEIQSNKTVKDLNKLVKNKLKDRFYNFVGLQSTNGYQVLDYILLDKHQCLENIHDHQQFKILLEGEVQNLHTPTLNDFTFIKCLGKGATSVVYLVRHNQNCKIYALKQIEKNYVDGFKRMQSILRERKILIQIANKTPFCSRIYCSFESINHLNFLLKYYPGGQLLYHLQQRKLTQNQLKLYFCQILIAIESLHKQSTIFRDLKPENIIIDLHGNAILSDFGLCKTNVKKSELTLSYCGSDIYMPPQIKHQIGYNYHADFYTLGALLYQMATGLPPHYNKKPLNFSEKLSKQVIELTLKMLQPDLKKRLCDFQQIKKNEWLKDIDWQKIHKKSYQMPIKLNPYQSYIHQEFKQISVAREINEQIFDRLFDFFYFMSQKQNGISKCYISNQSQPKQSSSQIIKGKKNASIKKEKLKDRSKSKNQNQKSPKIHEKNLFLNNNRKPTKLPQKIITKIGHLKEDKSKSLRKKSIQKHSQAHQLKKKQTSSNKFQTKNKKEKISNNQKQLKQGSEEESEEKKLNIYQKNPRRAKKDTVEKGLRNGSTSSKGSVKSLTIHSAHGKSINKRKQI